MPDTMLDQMLSGEAVGGPAESAVAGPEGSPDPVRKEVAGYRPSGGETACEGCEHFVAPEGCTRVLGQISASGVCDLWEPAQTDALMADGLDEFLFSGGGAPQGGGGMPPGGMF